MLRENWFPTPIWSIQTDIDTKPIAEKCLQMRAEGVANRIRTNRGGWQSKDINWEAHEELLVVRDSLLHHIDLLAKEIRYQKANLQLNNAWININERDHLNVEHIHPWCTFSGTFYVQTDDNTGDIRFTNKWCVSEHYGFFRGNSDIFYEFVTYKPKNGMILFFPAWLNHYVSNNESNLTRISISFNITEISPDEY